MTWSVPEEVHERLSADPLGSATVTELVSEGCWNAIRLTVRNDGPAPQAGESGLGLRMFTDMTLSWELAREGDTTVLTALVPVA